MGIIVCPNGHENAEENEYCARCGKKLIFVIEPSPTPPAISSEGAPPPSDPEQETGRRRRRVVILMLAGVVLVLVVVGVVLALSDEEGGSPAASSTAVVGTHSLTGVLAANECGGYTQISAASVEVRDENDKLIGSTTATPNVGPHSGYSCSVKFTVPDVPKAGFYQVTVGSHDGPTYSYAEMEAADWNLELSLGKPSGGSGGEPTTFRVTYRVEGDSSADLTYQSAGGGTSQKTGVSLPWTFRLKMKQGDFYYISAQNNGSGAIICQVLINGKLVKNTKSTGQYTICDASGETHSP